MDGKLKIIIFSIDLLESVFPKQTWNHNLPGIEIKEEYINNLESFFNKVKSIPNSTIDFGAVYF